jgi:flavin reductase (DIM6/NTAB) family NADH-FMN oxidoreductase RutF
MTQAYPTQDTHSIISPAILYWGTPVVLVSSENEDGSHNISAISSAFWLGHRCILGFGAGSETPKNILTRKECVLNLPDGSEAMAAHVNMLARTTGTYPVPPWKQSAGYRHVKDKWTEAGLTPQRSDFVRPARIKECPVQMECEFVASHSLMQDLPDRNGALIAIEVKVMRIHVLDSLRMDKHANRVDSDKWNPMIMNFQELYGVSGQKLVPSVLGRIDEEKYRLLAKSDVVKQPGDDDDAISVKRLRSLGKPIVNGVQGGLSPR